MEQFPNSAVSEEDEAAAAGRHGSRDSLLLAAQLRFDGDPEIHQVRVRNLSSGGLMAEFAEDVEIGARIQVDVRNIGWVKGRIAWATDGRLGVAFDREVDPMAARKPVGGGAKTPSFVKPIQTRR
ncbi:PilZ domain-containing protein [Sphingomonas sp. AX6]|uniref:PilZ domain-containing protein n=1 Tax=Sphingomonas sp. AX6 TaxID=2653171 RepID=UPI0012F2D7F7|nr:PilZ domain-containing protein [Sphingomonas sp. AX6]VXC85918.1 PilZ domain-containing protein [Sphingomonas sp. AX6]